MTPDEMARAENDDQAAELARWRAARLDATKTVGHIAVPSEMLADSSHTVAGARLARPQRRRDRWRRIAVDSAALAALTVLAPAARAWRAVRRRRPDVCPACHDEGDYGGCGTCGEGW